MGMPRLSIFAIANLHQTCLGLVWRFAQDGLSWDGDIPETIENLWYPHACQLTFVFNFRFNFRMMLVKIISNWFGVCWNSSCHKVSQTACILLWDAASDGQVVHHCPKPWRWTASTLSVCSAFLRIYHLTDSCLKYIAFFGLAMTILDVEQNYLKMLEGKTFSFLGSFNIDFC